MKTKQNINKQNIRPKRNCFVINILLGKCYHNLLNCFTYLNKWLYLQKMHKGFSTIFLVGKPFSVNSKTF